MIKIKNLNFEKISLNVFICLSVLFVFGLLFNFIGILPYWVNMKVLFALFIAGGVWFLVEKIKKIPEERREKNPMVYIFGYLFLLGLIVIAINQFLKRQIIIDWLFEISVLTIAFGFLTFYAHRNRVEKEIEDEKEKEEEKEKKRKEEFDIKFRKLTFFNFKYGIKENWKDKKYVVAILRAIISPFIWIARIPYSLVKWMYKEGWGFSIPFVIITLIFIGIKIAMILTYNGSYLDEYYHILSGIEFFKTGHFAEFTTEGIYLRGFLVSIIVGSFLKIFGQTITIAKLIPAIIGIINFFLLFFISRKVIKNRKYILLLLILYALSPWTIFNHFYIRFYIFYELYLLSSIFLLVKITDSINKRKKCLIYGILILIINIINLLTKDLGAYLILLINISFIIYILLNYTNLFKKFKKLPIYLLIIVFLTLFFTLNLSNKIELLLGGVSDLNIPTTRIFNNFFFNINYIFTIFFLLSVSTIKKIKSEETILIIGGIMLFLIHIISGNNLQLIRLIFYFLPLYFLISIYTMSKLNFKKGIFIIFVILSFIILYNNYPLNFLNAPYIPSEIRYMDNQVYIDALTICKNSLIIVSSRPGIANFFEIYPDYYVNTNYAIGSWMEHSESKYAIYDKKEDQFMEIFSNIPIIDNLKKIEEVYNSNSKICYIGGGLPSRWVNENVQEFVYNNSIIHLEDYKSSDESFKMYLYIK